MIYIPLFITVAGSTAYHIVQKYLPPNANPVLVLVVTYAVALIASLLLFIVWPLKESLQVETSRIGIPNVVLGLSIIGIEVGWVLAYRGMKMPPMRGGVALAVFWGSDFRRVRFRPWSS